MKRFTFFLVSLLVWIATNGQDSGHDPLLRAMQDEIDRNLKGLRQPGYDAPFFIMYGIQDQKMYTIGATLGSLSESSESSNRFKTTTRVLVGDYQFNDESLEDNLHSSPTVLEIGLPIDGDYEGVRRAFWSATDKIYRDAARHFKKHQEALRETGKTLDQIPHRSFAQAPPVRMVSTMEPYSFNKKEWEGRARQLSALFLKDPNIRNSGVMLRYVEGYRYLINTEGTVARVPFRNTTLFIGAQSRNSEGEFAMVNSLYLTETPGELPSVEELTPIVAKLVDDLKKQADVPVLDEEYVGPVLIMGAPVADLWSMALFDGGESIMANDNIAKLTGYQFDRDVMSLDGKIGKNLINQAITVKAKPHLKSYQGVRLLGSFDIDNEGVVPGEEVTIFEKGVLRNLLNNRTITNPSQAANGFASGPGVLEISVDKQMTNDELKELLIARAKEEGLDYALIVRESPAAGMGMMNIYKVSVSDGSEQLMRNGLFSRPGLKTMRQLLGASSTSSAHNIGGRGGFNGMGSVMSVICPDAILMGEMEIAPFGMPVLKEEDYIPNPLLANQ